MANYNNTPGIDRDKEDNKKTPAFRPFDSPDKRDCITTDATPCKTPKSPSEKKDSDFY